MSYNSLNVGDKDLHLAVLTARRAVYFGRNTHSLGNQSCTTYPPIFSRSSPYGLRSSTYSATPISQASTRKQLWRRYPQLTDFYNKVKGKK